MNNLLSFFATMKQQLVKLDSVQISKEMHRHDGGGKAVVQPRGYPFTSRTCSMWHLVVWKVVHQFLMMHSSWLLWDPASLHSVALICKKCIFFSWQLSLMCSTAGSSSSRTDNASKSQEMLKMPLAIKSFFDASMILWKWQLEANTLGLSSAYFD